ncbi:MAG: T9SS type A sorting domain-containing protein [Ignavibacteriaceae bacterium]|nr:T9SS type A sorting domain-containing protein [Ignavibacteriaceae bacterium]
MKNIILILLTITTVSFSQVRFDANFDSGNINTVNTTDSINYTVTTHEDIGGRWFYFRIAGVKNKYISVRVSNSDVTRAMYSYDNDTFTRFSGLESPSTNVFQKTYTEDTVFVAYYTPYNYSHLLQRLNDWSQSSFVKVDTLGITEHNLAIHEITVTDTSVSDSLKENIWIHARTHPGETPSSWHFDGLVETLLSDDDVISFYRQKLVFHLIPFVNPEGVYYGRSRTNFNYVDLEQQWQGADSTIQLEARILRTRLKQINNGKPVKVFLNLHSQASPFCTFWIHTAQSTSTLFYRNEYQFAYLNTSGNPYFTQNDFSESSLKPYFPEGWLWYNYNDSVMALTYETPYDKYSTGTWVDNDNLAELGDRTVYAIAEYLGLSHPKHIILDNTNAFLAGNWTSYTTTNKFYGDDYILIPKGDGSNYAKFETEPIQGGQYDVYAWWPNSGGFSYNTKFIISANGNEQIIEKTQQTNGAQWNYLTDVNLSADGSISIKVSDLAGGTVCADAFKIVYKGPALSVRNDIGMPEDFKLYQNYPNPFNPRTTIRFNLQKRENVKLRVFNPLGELVKVLVDQELGEGTHEAIFNADRISSGIYYYNLTAGEQSETRGMIFIK